MLSSEWLPAVVLLVGIVVLVAAWLLHWILTIVGVVLIFVAVYLAFGGQIAGI
jgi:ABC-type glycerol-3-phosphate transport system permease component